MFLYMKHSPWGYKFDELQSYREETKKKNTYLSVLEDYNSSNFRVQYL